MKNISPILPTSDASLSQDFFSDEESPFPAILMTNSATLSILFDSSSDIIATREVFRSLFLMETSSVLAVSAFSSASSNTDYVKSTDSEQESGKGGSGGIC